MFFYSGQAPTFPSPTLSGRATKNIAFLRLPLSGRNRCVYLNKIEFFLKESTCAFLFIFNGWNYINTELQFDFSGIFLLHIIMKKIKLNISIFVSNIFCTFWTRSSRIFVFSFPWFLVTYLWAWPCIVKVSGSPQCVAGFNLSTLLGVF